MMTSDLWALIATIGLAMGQLTIASILTLRQLGGRWVAGPRDEPRAASGISGRFVRAHRNLLEIFPQFVAALFVVHARRRRILVCDRRMDIFRGAMPVCPGLCFRSDWRQTCVLDHGANRDRADPCRLDPIGTLDVSGFVQSTQ
jgi:MAPEG family